MNQAQYSQLVSFIWNIATDVLVNAFDKGEYKKIILPMMVLRRIDVLLEPTKEAVKKMNEQLDKNHIENKSPILCGVSRYPFYNISNYTMKTLKSETDPARLKLNFLEYLNGFSKDVLDIVEKLHLRQVVDNLTEEERLGSIIEKFTSDKINLSINPVVDENGKIIQPGLDNHSMGTVFEELLRKFNEENNVTEAGEHFTPRDYVKLLAELAVVPVADKLTDNTYSIYDGACGTGGILTIAQERIQELAKERGKNVVINIFGQEQAAETYATCKADLMISGNIQSFQYHHNAEEREYISFGSTLSQDGHAGESFDFCISNPPFGTPWKEDLKKKGLSTSDKDREKFNDPRFGNIDKEGNEVSFLPKIDDCQMMFLANNLSRMQNDTELGTRIVEIHNGSSIFNGDAGKGVSNLRKYIIENDLLEAIIQMPENEFYNTGINTYIWIVTNRKEERRKGKVQLIDASAIKTPLRKNLGEKNCETNDLDRAAILKLLMDFEENEQSKIFENREFGYWQITVERPLRMHIRIDKENIERMVKHCLRDDIEFSQNAVEALAEFGIDASYKDNTPIANLSDALAGCLPPDVRSFKFPKTKADLNVDIVFSIAMLVITSMAKKQTLYLDYNKFEKEFDNNPYAKSVKLKFDQISDLFYYLKEKDPNAEPIIKNGKIITDKSLKDSEQVPLLYEGGVGAFMKNEVLPYAPDAFIDESKSVIGYELSFTKYFYKPLELRSREEITTEIRELEKETDGLLNSILND